MCAEKNKPEKNKHVYLLLNDDDYTRFVNIMNIFSLNGTRSIISYVVNDTLKRYKSGMVVVEDPDINPVKWKRDEPIGTNPISGYLNEEQVDGIAEIIKEYKFLSTTDVIRWMIRDSFRYITGSLKLKAKHKLDNVDVNKQASCDDIIHVRISTNDNDRFNELMLKKRIIKKSRCWRWIISEFLDEHKINEDLIRKNSELRYFYKVENLSSVAFRISSKEIETMKTIIKNENFKNLSELIRFMIRWVYKNRMN